MKVFSILLVATDDADLEALWLTDPGTRGVTTTRMPRGGPGSQMKRTILGAYNFARKVGSPHMSAVARATDIIGCVSTEELSGSEVSEMLSPRLEWLIFDGESFIDRFDASGP